MSKCYFCEKDLGGSNCVSYDICDSCQKIVDGKNYIELIRYSPKELNINDIMLIIQGHGTDNDSLYNSNFKNNVIPWKIKISVQRIDETNLDFFDKAEKMYVDGSLHDNRSPSTTEKLNKKYWCIIIDDDNFAVGVYSIEKDKCYETDSGIMFNLRKYSYANINKKDIFNSKEEAIKEFNKRYPDISPKFEKDCFDKEALNY